MLGDGSVDIVAMRPFVDAVWRDVVQTTSARRWGWSRFK
jgi:hypothetical protein